MRFVFFFAFSRSSRATDYEAAATLGVRRTSRVSATRQHLAAVEQRARLLSRC
jgi:hypothetical protein